ncbi:substrate-binding domain-containing protein [Trichlorobacter lovleyi]|uniref:substrate-binding domain-containing protein n=1 Tax=Trichlorobacter lovleyi TaxID=313985 RepID=UPI0023F47F14|nr:substrate-binding domain-containing protein [Trichlorobacter lovleyi]
MHFSLMKRVVAAMALTLVAGTAFAEDIRIGAGAAPTENILKPIRAAFEKASGITLNTISNGPKQAFIELEKGTVDAAAAGLALDDWWALLKKEGVAVANPGAYQGQVIGKDRVVVITHKDNRLPALSKEQLQGIFSGKTQNWKDVGGKDMPILIVWGSLIPGTNSMFSKVALGGTAVTKEVLDATTAEDVKDKVKSNPEAIGIGPAAIVDDSIWSPKSPEVARDITLLTKGAPSAKIQKLLGFIKGDGAKLIK